MLAQLSIWSAENHLSQGRPVRALYDAWMHHGQNRGRNFQWKKRILFENRGKCRHFCKIGTNVKVFRKQGGQYVHFAKVGAHFKMSVND